MSLELKDMLGPAAALIALAVGLWQYRVTAEREFLKPIREAQLRLYEEASSAAAGVATLDRAAPEWKKARADFLRLYFGPLAIVEDYHHAGARDPYIVTVEEAMMKFKDCLDDERCETENARLRIQSLSLALAHTCRVSLARTWGYKFDQLQGDYQKLIRDKRQAAATPAN